MSNADAFKRLVKNRQQQTEQLTEAEPPPEKVSTPIEQPTIEPSPQPPVEQQPQKRGRGRPATGKRSDDAWLGRTYYVKRETDLDVEDELLNLKRQGIEIDKSELVDSLLAAWVEWRHGKDSEILLGEISPRRKGKE
ncbi:hypothetical protein H6F95_02095 [Cyanobacteria bacterium FACHB-471]|nr:hypothetical protein [Cyanobacteria bacterium FACHB-471]